MFFGHRPADFGISRPNQRVERQEDGSFVIGTDAGTVRVDGAPVPAAGRWAIDPAHTTAFNKARYRWVKKRIEARDAA